MREAYYQFFVNRNYIVKERYEGFVRSHRSLHGIKKIIPWSYLLGLNLKYNLLHCAEHRPSKVGEESNTGFTLSVEETLTLLEDYDVISFDVFDTLLTRPTSSPQDVFYFVGESLGIPDFRRLRIEAEALARKKKRESGQSSEVELADIYRILARHLAISAEEGMTREIQTETSLCMGNPFLQAVWRGLLTKGKTIVITTDMYLPRRVIEDLLEGCGYQGYAKIYLSCEHGCGKYDGGLYARLQADYPNQACIHIGDNLHSDIHMAKARGIATLHYPNLHTLGLSYRPQHISPIVGSVYRGILDWQMYWNPKVSSGFAYGYTYGGLLLLGFCDWIHEQAKDHEGVLFLSRDGYIVKKLYDTLYPEDTTEYIHWSRAAAAKLCVGLYPHDYVRRFLTQKVTLGMTIGEIFRAMELDAMEIPFPREEVFSAKWLEEITDFVYDRLEEIQLHYSKGLARAEQYFTEKIGKAKRLCTVDCGWAGSGNILLEAFLQRHVQCDVTLTGLLCGTNARKQLDSDFSETYLQTERLRAYCYSSADNRLAYETHFSAKKHNVFFELLFGAPEPSFLGFSEKGLSYDSVAENKEIVEEIHKGELAFVEQYLRICKAFPYLRRISGSDAYAPFLTMIEDGKGYPLSIFQDCLFDEGVNGQKKHIHS